MSRSPTDRPGPLACGSRPCDESLQRKPTQGCGLLSITTKICSSSRNVPRRKWKTQDFEIGEKPHKFLCNVSKTC